MGKCRLVNCAWICTFMSNESIIMKRILPLLFAFFLASSFTINAQTTVDVGNTTLTENIVATGLNIPWEIIYGPDNHLWVTERAGRVKRINPENGNTTTILDIDNQVWGGDGEPGLLGMALHPDFENNGRVYMVYTYGGFGNRKERLSYYTWDGTSLSGEVQVLSDLPAQTIHNGSRLLFLPDGTLLMTTGDIGNSSNSQNMNTLMGKTLRMNDDGTIPADNPDPNSLIYTYGNRNAQGLCLAPDGTIYSSEHGQNHSDEVNIIKPDTNYGWPNVEGPCNTSIEIDYCNNVDVEEPIWAWTSYCIAPNGLVYYDHEAIPEFQNSLLVSILGGISAQEPRISHLELSADGQTVVSETEYFTNYGRIRDVAINPANGAIYFATNGPSYPGSGPNMIVEYRNEAYFPSSNPYIGEEDQFINVTPNPISGRGKIEFSENFIGHNYEIISYDGKVVQSGTITEQEMILRKRNLASGAYYIKATNKRGTITRTIIMK